MTALASCGSDSEYGANLGYPDEPPLPPSATVVAEAKGWDDDDPMRGREVVVDIGNSRQAELVRFYRERFPSDVGWQEGEPDADVGGGHLLCLVRQSNRRFDEYVEIYPYDRLRYKSAGPHRYLVSISRLHVFSGGGERTVDRCGLASIWFPSNL